MRFSHSIRALLFIALGLLGWACSTSISTDLDGKLCDSQQRCSAGYSCNIQSNTCEIGRAHV